MISRYTTEEMVKIWSDEAKYCRWRDIELAALQCTRAVYTVPNISQKSVNICINKAGEFTPEDIKEIEEIEKVTKHDFIAFLTFMEKRIGPASRWLHFGLTSSDVVDTALSMALRDSIDVILSNINRLTRVIKEKALEHKYTLMIGRTHGMHAEPISLGHKFAIWYEELERHYSNLLRTRSVVGVGKLSGAVGNYANIVPQVEERVCNILGLEPVAVANQVIGRDRHARYFTELALLGSTLEKIATEFRHLQRTEVGEISEGFTEGQKGSSAMAHKHNPISAENICGLARILRGYALSAMEDVSLWHERDISHSSVERIIGPDASNVCDYMITRLTKLIMNMVVNENKMEENLNSSFGVVCSQRIMLELIKGGMSRSRAYKIMQEDTAKALAQRMQLSDVLYADHRVKFSSDELMSLCNTDFAGDIEEVFTRIFGKDE
jgi:adenylosuccinate lyase